MFLEILNLLVSLFAVASKMAKNKLNKRSKDINNNKKKNVETEPEFFMKSCSVVLTRLKNLPIAKKSNKNSKNRIKTQNRDQNSAIHETVSTLVQIFS